MTDEREDVMKAFGKSGRLCIWQSRCPNWTENRPGRNGAAARRARLLGQLFSNLALWASLSVLLPVIVSSCPAHAETVDAYIRREMHDRQIPGLAYAIVDRGVVTTGAYGVSNLETDTPLHITDIFEVASVIKPFTAIAVMQLVESGKVGLDDRISNYIPNSPQSWADITVRELLSHTSGLPIDSWVGWDGSPLLTITTKQHLHQLSGEPLLFPPGTGASYSDGGYFLLGVLIEQVSGQKYRDYMREHIFMPAGMESTLIENRRQIVKHHVTPYEMADGRLVNTRRVWDHELPSYFGLWTTVGDMVRWNKALGEGRLLRPATLHEMWTPSRLKDGAAANVDGFPYGLGWFVPTTAGHRIVGHVGYYGSVFFKLPEDSFTIILFASLATTNGPYQVTLAAHIASLRRPDLAPAFAPMMNLGPPAPAARKSRP
jgi:CubicO group peptidase (beta-lactamase class C family)